MDLEYILRRDRLVVTIALTFVIGLCWFYVLMGAGMGMSAVDMTLMSRPIGFGAHATPGPSEAGGGMSEMAGTMDPGRLHPWTPGYAMLMLFMWWIMMVGMMLPSASPVLLLYARLMRKEREKGAPYVSTSTFALGYIVMWGAFSTVATAAQRGLEVSGLLSSMMVGTSVTFGAILLIAAGGWQLTPFKHACLRHCRSPIGFLSRFWRPGAGGAFRMGMMHGAYCLGCCWFLMALLFYGGVMNLYWIIGLALFVLIEKITPAGARIGQLIGAVLVVWGGALLLGP